LIAKVEEGLITVFCILILYKWGTPWDGISIWKIKFGSDERIKNIWLFVDQLLDPLLTSLYPRALRNTWHGLFPYHSHEGKFTIEGLTPSPLVLSLP